MSTQTSPTTTEPLRRIINRVVEESERKKADKDTCGGCARKAALATVSFRGRVLGRLCRFCPWTSFLVTGETEAKDAKKPRRKGR